MTPPAPENNLYYPAASLGARPARPDRAEYLFFITASCIFLLGMLAFLGYSYLDPVRERLSLLAGPVAPGGRVASAFAPGI